MFDSPVHKADMTHEIKKASCT